MAWKAIIIICNMVTHQCDWRVTDKDTASLYVCTTVAEIVGNRLKARLRLEHPNTPAMIHIACVPSYVTKGRGT